MSGVITHYYTFFHTNKSSTLNDVSKQIVYVLRSGKLWLNNHRNCPIFRNITDSDSFVLVCLLVILLLNGPQTWRLSDLGCTALRFLYNAQQAHWHIYRPQRLQLPNMPVSAASRAALPSWDHWRLKLSTPSVKGRKNTGMRTIKRRFLPKMSQSLGRFTIASIPNWVGSWRERIHKPRNFVYSSDVQLSEPNGIYITRMHSACPRQSERIFIYKPEGSGVHDSPVAVCNHFPQSQKTLKKKYTYAEKKKKSYLVFLCLVPSLFLFFLTL